MKNLIQTVLCKLSKSSFGILVLSLIISGDINAQIDPLQEANLHFEQGLYHQALIFFDQVEKINSSAPLLFKRAICYYETNDLERARSDFSRAWEFGYKNPKTDLYIGLINLHQGAFEEAAEYLKSYLASLSFDDPEKEKTRKLIKQCGNALEISYQRPLAIVENPRSLNSLHHEFRMIESPAHENRYYFTSNRPKSLTTLYPGSGDIYFAEGNIQLWEHIGSLPGTINTDAVEVGVGFSRDAEVLYFFRGSGMKGHLMKIWQHEGRDTTEEMRLPFDIDFRNADVFIYDDSVILFASDQLPGFGGYDLFYSVNSGSSWSEPVNLGSQINTSYDEISPFLTMNGKHLYFSSNREFSVGGYDVFTASYLQEANKWSPPVNMGIPINSPGDERYFQISQDGYLAFFASNRKNASGGFDVHVGRFKDQRDGWSSDWNALGFVDYGELGQAHIDSIQDISFVQQPVEQIEEAKPEMTTESHGVREAFSFQPLFYTTNRDVLSPVNQDELLKIADLLKNQPLVELELLVNTNNDGILEYNLFSSLKIGEKVESFLVNQGIDEKRIFIKGLGSNYPLIKYDTEGGNEGLADKINQRIEFRFHSYDETIDVNRIAPDISGAQPSLKYDLFEAIIEEVVTYKLQIAMVNQMYRGIALELFNDPSVEEHQATGLYAYTVGIYDTYALALKNKRDLERAGLVDVTVIPYINGMRISNHQLVYYVNDFPDLKNYMNYQN